MSRLPDINDVCSSPDDLDEPFDYDGAARDADRANDSRPVRHKWVDAEVVAYREALVRVGLSVDAIEDLIERDCGREFCRRPMLVVRQAGAR